MLLPFVVWYCILYIDCSICSPEYNWPQYKAAWCFIVSWTIQLRYVCCWFNKMDDNRPTVNVNNYWLEYCLCLFGQWRLLQLQNDRSHTRHISTRFAWLWIEIAQLSNTFPFGARFDVIGLGHKLFLGISAFTRTMRRIQREWKKNKNNAKWW